MREIAPMSRGVCHADIEMKVCASPRKGEAIPQSGAAEPPWEFGRGAHPTDGRIYRLGLRARRLRLSCGKQLKSTISRRPLKRQLRPSARQWAGPRTDGHSERACGATSLVTTPVAHAPGPPEPGGEPARQALKWMSAPATQTATVAVVATRIQVSSHCPGARRPFFCNRFPAHASHRKRRG